jgi:hypothetical protein
VHLALDTEEERRTRLTALLEERGARPVATRPANGYANPMSASTIVESFVHKLSGLWPEEAVAKIRLLQFYDPDRSGSVEGKRRKKAAKALESYDKLINKGRLSFQQAYDEVMSFRNGARGLSRVGAMFFRIRHDGTLLSRREQKAPTPAKRSRAHRQFPSYTLYVCIAHRA